MLKRQRRILGVFMRDVQRKCRATQVDADVINACGCAVSSASASSNPGQKLAVCLCTRQRSNASARGKARKTYEFGVRSKQGVVDLGSWARSSMTPAQQGHIIEGK